MSRLLFIMLFGVSCSLQVHAEIYKWTDSNGRIGYGNIPPGGDSSVKSFVSKTRNPEPVVNNVSNTKEALSTEEREKKIAADREKEAKIASQNCSKSKESLQMLESGVRVVRYNAQGEREVLDDKTRTVEMENAKRSIKEWCESF